MNTLYFYFYLFLISRISAKKKGSGCGLCGIEFIGESPGLTGSDYTDYIVGSQARETQVNRYPWMVNLNGNGGGTLISSKYVLTAAHCVWGKHKGALSNPLDKIKVILGDHDKKLKNGTFLERKIFGVVDVIVHENYKRKNGSDIALLELAEEVDTSVYTPACLPKQSTDETYENKTATAIGWGRTSGIIQQNKKVEEICEQKYEELGIPQGEKNKLQEVQITLTRNKNKNKRSLLKSVIDEHNNGICVGDSGGPLLYKDGEQNIVIGITSSIGSKYVGPCKLTCMPGGNMWFTKIPDYMDWISENMKRPKFCSGGSHVKD